jgi:cytochrome P450
MSETSNGSNPVSLTSTAWESLLNAKTRNQQPGPWIIAVLLLAITCLSYSAHHLTQRRSRKLSGGINLSTGWWFKERFRWLFYSPSVLASGYDHLKNKGAPYVQITIEDGSQNVVFNHRYTKQLAALSDAHLSFDEAAKSLTAGKYTKIANVPQGIGQDAVRAELTSNVPRVVGYMATEVEDALRKVLPQTAEWELRTVSEVAMEPVAQASARVFVGPKLCRDEAWMSIMRNFTHMAAGSLQAVKMWPAFLHPWVAPFLPALKTVKRTWAEGRRVLREAAEAEASDETKGDYIKQWVAQRHPEWAADLDQQVDFTFTLSMAALHTSEMTTTHLLLDLAAHPQFADELRAEIKEALEQTGGEMNNSYIHKLQKLDSFMMESKRLSPLTLYSFQRLAMRDFELEDGTFVPRGTFLALDASQGYMDGELWADPEVFDPLRFYRLRQAEGAQNSHLFVTSNAQHMSWGQGKHTCPGRKLPSSVVLCLISVMPSSTISLVFGETLTRA